MERSVGEGAATANQICRKGAIRGRIAALAVVNGGYRMNVEGRSNTVKNV